MMKKVTSLLIFLSCFLLVSGQEKQPVTTDTTVVDSLRPHVFKIIGKPSTGLAALYNLDRDGSKTASGEAFFNIQRTAASDEFAFNDWVKVTNLLNNKSTIVRINDRLLKGEKKRKVKINLSREAAGEIGVTKDIVFKVKVELISVNDSLVNKLKADSIQNQESAVKEDSAIATGYETYGKAVTGIASFYSASLDGSKTSTGERYRNAKLTAASNHFKLNTWVLVTNLRNRKSVIVRINDRMHPRMKRKGRVVDLSREAARQLDFMGDGLTRVKVQPVRLLSSPVVSDSSDSSKIAVDSNRVVADSVEISKEKEETSVTGIASFYSSNLDGTKTATGERYRNSKLSAASNHFDLNTWVRVTNLSNGRSVVLRINDRMHPRMKEKGRVVDLSRVAASKLGFIKKGLTRVKVEPVEKGTAR